MPSSIQSAHRAQGLAQSCEVLLDVVVHAEVDEGEPVGAVALDLVDRLLPGVEIELRRRTRRHDERASSDTHSGRVAGVEGALGVEIRDVVPCVPGRREAVEPHHASPTVWTFSAGTGASSPQRASKASP